MLQSKHACGSHKLNGIALVLLLSAQVATAQSQPDAGRLLQETQPSIDRSTQSVIPVIRAPEQPHTSAAPTNSDVRVKVTEFDITGNSALSTDTLRASTAAWLNRPLSFSELQQAVEAIETSYKRAGYFLAQATLPPQKIHDGVIQIAVSEGRLGNTRLEGNSHVAPKVVLRYLNRLPANEAITLLKLERQVLLINELAGEQTRLDLQAGAKPGTTDVVIVQQTSPKLTGQVDANNYGAASTGQNRLGLTLNGNSLFGWGERISFNTMRSDTSGLNTYSMRGELPVAGNGWRLTGALSRANYSLGDAFASLDASGTADSVRIGASYPVIRSSATNLVVQIETDHSKLVDSYRASNTELDKQASGLSLTTSADWQNDALGEASSHLSLVLRSGQLDLGSEAALRDAPPKGSGTAGSFGKLNMSYLRQQALSQNINLQAQFEMQVATKNLDSSEKMSLGGSGSIPGYVNSQTSADDGAHLKLGLRRQVAPQFISTPLVLTAFADYAYVHLQHDPLPTATESNQRHLSDAGMSADWVSAKGISTSTTLAWPVHKPASPDNASKPRLWVAVGWAW